MRLEELLEELAQLPRSALTARVSIDSELVDADIVSVDYANGVVVLRIDEDALDHEDAEAGGDDEDDYDDND